MVDNYPEYPEQQYDSELKNKAVHFVMNFDNENERDRFHVAELIYSVPERTIRSWFLEKSLELLHKTLTDMKKTGQEPGKASSTATKNFMKLKNLNRLLEDIRDYNDI